MNDEIILRKQAIELHLKGILKSDIAFKVGRSRQWVHKWIKRYLEIGGDLWYKSLSNVPNKVPVKTASDIENLVVSIRKALDSRKYSQKGALSIIYELNKMGVTCPSITTINRILKRHNLIGESLNKLVKKRIIPIIIPLFSRWILLALNILQVAYGFTFWTL